ncbi:TPA: hypothetical protein IFZ83_003918 [Escherichia coli]|nr:hypothetical protein [Escherichia coli]HAN6219510.1 hypothetical protein [Escherichia coli]
MPLRFLCLEGLHHLMQAVHGAKAWAGATGVSLASVNAVQPAVAVPAISNPYFNDVAVVMKIALYLLVAMRMPSFSSCCSSASHEGLNGYT